MVRVALSRLRSRRKSCGGSRGVEVPISWPLGLTSGYVVVGTTFAGPDKTDVCSEKHSSMSVVWAVLWS
jgi:hypothetical protein